MIKLSTEEFNQEQERCRELVEAYRAIGPAGTFGRIMIKNVLDEADEAAKSGDALRIIEAYAAMKGCE